MLDEHEGQALTGLAAERRNRFYGKYRGVVKSVLEGSDLGKLVVNVPDVYDDQDSPVAWPCVPFAGPSHGLVAMPEAGDGVWIEFEAGDPSRPIWTGSWWGSGDVPSTAAPKVKVFTSTGGLQIVLDDDQNELRLEHPSGAKISLTETGISFEFNSTTITLDDTGITMNDTVTVSP